MHHNNLAIGLLAVDRRKYRARRPATVTRVGSRDRPENKVFFAQRLKSRPAGGVQQSLRRDFNSGKAVRTKTATGDAKWVVDTVQSRGLTNRLGAVYPNRAGVRQRPDRNRMTATE